MESENYVYKKEIDWSTLMEGFTLPLDNQVIFLRNMENFLQRGQSKIIHFFMNGKTYDAKIVNMNNSVEKRKKDAYQIRYPRNGELSQALQQYFFKSMSYIKMIRENRDPKDRSYIKMPDGLKEYLAIYTTEYEDTFLLEPIAQDDFQVMKKAIQGMRERTVENEIEYEIGLRSVINEIINLFGMSAIKAHFPAYQQRDYFEKLVEKFEIYLEDELQKTSYDWILALENFFGKNSVPIMTIHKSKGLEYSAVYFVGLEDGAFWSFKSQPDEDRCAFFVAISRAKKYLMFTYCSYRAKLKFPRQSHKDINEFFELLQTPGVAEIQEIHEE